MKRIVLIALSLTYVCALSAQGGSDVGYYPGAYHGARPKPYPEVSLQVRPVASPQSNLESPAAVRPFEFEAGVGAIVNAERGNGSSLGPTVFVEARHNFRNPAFSLGLQAMLGYWDGDHGEVFETITMPGTPANTHYENEWLWPLSVTVYGDYNFVRGRKVSLFGGAGVGVTTYAGEAMQSSTFFTLSPRVGVEFARRLRFTVDYKMIGSEYQTFGVGLGITFGHRAR
jgi:hypothetical protein